MNTDLETRLREQQAAVGLDRPVDDIFRRGHRLRRRRSAALAGAGAGAAVAVLAGSIALPPGSSPVVTSAVAAWSGGPTNLSPEELRDVTRACATRLPIPDDAVPAAAEVRRGTVLAYYRPDDTQVTCVAHELAGRSVAFVRGSTEDYTPLPEGADLGFAALGSSDPGVEGGSVTDLWTVSEVSERVDRVTAEIGGATYDGTIIDGVVLFWETGNFDRHQVDDAVFTAYDAEGHVLDRVERAGS